jgi:H+/Cl- antiporter ClcA
VLGLLAAIVSAALAAVVEHSILGSNPVFHLKGAVFAGTIRAPMTSVLIIFEMTGGYGLVLPLMIAIMSAYALARHWRRTPVYEALLAQDGIYLPHGSGPLDLGDNERLPGMEPNEAP